MNIAVLMTCHNRKELTLRCLDSLLVAAKELEFEVGVGEWKFDIFLVDDGSTDGTSEAVQKWFRDNSPLFTFTFHLHLLRGSGRDYWARGMARAWQAALGYEEDFIRCSTSPSAFAFYLWLNDDIVLDADSLLKLQAAIAQSSETVWVGALRDTESGAKVYGIMPNGMMTGSFACVPRSVYERVGMICGGYRHAWADCDYSLTCRKSGVPVSEFGIVGLCHWHEARPWLNGKGLCERLALLHNPKGWCLHDVWLFRRRHFGLVRAAASSIHLAMHVLCSEWGWWRPLYGVMSLLPRRGQKLMWRLLRRSGFATLLNDEGFCKLQLLGAGGERYALPADGGGLNSVIAWQRLHWPGLLPRVCSDKLAVREFVRGRCGEELLNEIFVAEFDRLPDSFVLKCSTGSGMNRIVRDKRSVDWAEVERQMSKWMHGDYSRFSRETQYAGVKPRVFAERLLLAEDGKLPNDYKFMCSDGTVLFCRVDEDRFGDHRRACYSRTGERLDVQVGYADYPMSDLPLPGNWRAMVETAERLSVGIPLVRVDLYSVRGKVVFGEMTFTSGAGFEGIRPFSFSQQMARKVRGIKCPCRS